MAANEVVVKFLGDSSSFEKAVSKVVAGLGTSGSGFAKYATVAAGAGAAIGAIGGALYKVGEDFDAVNDHLRVATGATGDKLKGLEADFKTVVKDVPTDFKSAGDAVAFVAQKMDATGKTGRGLSEQFLELSRITGTDLQANMQSATDALNVFGVRAADAPAILNEMFRASQQSGVAFSDLASQVADSQTTLSQFHFTIGETTALVATLGKEGLSTSDVIPALGKALAAAAKDGVPAQQFLADTFATIKNAPNDTKAAGDAMEVFGTKAGTKFAGLIRSGKLSYDDMLKSITSGKDTIRKAGADTEDFSEKWTKIKNQVFVAAEPLATKLFNAIGAGADAFSKLSPGMQQAIVLGGGLITVLGGLSVAAAVIGPLFAEGAVGAAAFGIALDAIPFVAVGAAVALLAVVIAKNWDTIKNAFLTGVRFVADQILGMVGTIIHAAASAFGWVPGIGPKLKDAASKFDQFRDDVNRALGGIKDKTVQVNLVQADNSGRRLHAFAKGGFVPGPKGAPQVILAHGGEYVVSNDDLDGTSSRSPLDVVGQPAGGSRGDLTVIVQTGQVLATERDVAAAVVQGLEYHFAHGGAIGNGRGAYLKP